MNVRRLVLTVLALLGAARLEAASLQVKFIGNAAFEITDGDMTLLTDFPYQSGAFGYMEYRAEDVAPEGPVLCLITHAHADHFDRALFEKTAWSILGPPEVTRGLDTARVVPFGKEVRFRSLRAQPFSTPHGDVEHFSYLLTWKTQKLYFTGDTEKLETLEGLRGIDALFVTPWLLRAAEAAGTRLPGKKIVLHHHRAGEALPECDKCLAPQPGTVFEIK